MEPDGGIGPERLTTLPTGPHPTVGPGTVRMPRWPGPLMGIGGAILFLSALGAIGALDEGLMEVEDPRVLGWMAVIGGILFAAGLVYASIRQLRVRRHLPPERYRGPSVLLLVGLVLVATNVIAIPFLEELEGLVTGEGDLSVVGSVVLLVATQVALLLVVWFFVVRPRALATVPIPGPDTPAAVRTGAVWGILGWLAGTAVSVVVVLVLEALNLEATPQTAEQALAAIEPWLAIPAIVVVAPIAEEAFFRGVVFNAWLREAGRRIAYIGSAVLFGVIHLNLVAFVPIVVLGFILAYVYERTRNLWAPIVVHAVFNGINVAIFYLEHFGVIQFPG